MKRKLMLFGALLFIFLLAGTAGANTETDNTNEALLSPNPADVCVQISCDKPGPFKMGDIVKITATFDRPVSSAVLSLSTEDEFPIDEPIDDAIEDIIPDVIPEEFVDDEVVSDESLPQEPSSNGTPAQGTDPNGSLPGEIDLNIPLLEEGILPEDGILPDDLNLPDNGVLPDDGTLPDEGGIPGEMFPDGIFFSDEMNKESDTVWTYEYEVEDGINGAVDITVFAIDLKGEEGEETSDNAFIIDNMAPEFTRIEPEEEFVGTTCVPFNFSAHDELDSEIDYELYINDDLQDSGVILSDSYKYLEVDLPDGHYTWEAKLKDQAGNIGSSGIFEMYVDTEAPRITLLSPKDGYVDSTGDLTFGFTANDSVTNGNLLLELNYELYVDGEIVEELGSGTMNSGEYVEIPSLDLADGLHNCSVYVEDRAGNSDTSETVDFYVNVEGLEVSLASPDKEYVTEDPVFTFGVSGGPGLPFDCKLLINGEEVETEACDEGDNDGFVVGDESLNYYSVDTDLADAENIAWAVRVTDCAGNVYEPEPYHFTLDTLAPASVVNLKVVDAIGESEWSYTYDYPALYVSWDENDEDDLAPMPYEVFISDFKPSSVDDMEKLELESMEQSLDTDLYIEEYKGKPLVYGKDYWVAVIALDNAGNYNKLFSYWGPVQTYEDMDICLDAGWNLKSVPKRLAPFDAAPEAVFGEGCTVIYWDGNCWQFPDTIEPCRGYWVYSPETLENNIKFKAMSHDSTAPDVPASLELSPGWQMIGHSSTNPAAWSTTLASLKDVLIDYKFSNLITYSHDEGWGGIIPTMEGLIGQDGVAPTTGAFVNDELTPSPVEALQYEGYMVPGQGYWVFVKEESIYASIDSVFNYQDDSEPEEDETSGDEIADNGTDNNGENGEGSNEETSNGTDPEELDLNGIIPDVIDFDGVLPE